MLDDRHPEHPRVLERPSHQQRRRDRMPIVGDRHASGLLQLGDVREQLPFRALRNGSNRVDVRELRLGSLGKNEQGDVGVVVHRRGVRHARDCGESARDRRRDTTRDRFLVLLPWLAQVHVHVDQTRTHHQTGRNLHDGRAIDRQIASDSSDAAVLDEDVVHAINPVRGIDDAPALKQPLHVRLRPPGDTGLPCARRHRWQPGRGSPNRDRRRLPKRSRHRGSSDPGA